MYLLFSLLIFSSVSTWAMLPTQLPPGDYTPQKLKYDMPLPKSQKIALREDALRRAKVWREPVVAIERANLADNETASDGFNYENELVCKWAPGLKLNGASPKFFCTLPNGDTVKVKYPVRGKANAEIQGEVLSSRLLRALGFGADRMYLVRKVRCFGCPSDPWIIISQMHSPHETIRKEFFMRFGTINRDGEYEYLPNYREFIDFEEVAIERRMDGKRIEAQEGQGWHYKELTKVDSSAGGSTRSEVDALRLLSSFIQHSDNKPDNQVLVCLDASIRKYGRCESPFAAPHDLGGTFGSGFHKTKHNKVEVDEWSQTPIWTEGCQVHVKTSLSGGFGKSPISEAGRVFLASLLNRLSDGQIRDLFNGIHVAQLNFGVSSNRDVESWVRVFKAKRSQVIKQRCQ